MTHVIHEAADDATSWDWMTPTQFWAIIAINVGTLLAAYVWLRVLWPPHSKEEMDKQKKLHKAIEKVQEDYGTLPKIEDCIEGDVMGSYEAPWTETFDLVFLVIMLGFLVALCAWTQVAMPSLWTNGEFWLSQLPKIASMMGVSILGGLLCRKFCDVDEKGYIITNKKSAFKVNYTRKLQHFAAYVVPLVLHSKSVHGPLSLAWGDWFTLLAFLVMIQPVRESLSFIMLQWNSLDRPEDRPNTMKWIVGGNILPGTFLIVLFRYLLAMTNQQDLAFIFVFITGIGDGLAEPVGIYTGKHKYWTASCGGGRRYQRSFEGSACVWYSAVLFCSVWWSSFKTPFQFWVAVLILPPVMAYAEATSPHTMDTPFLMGLGGIILWFVCHVDVLWLE